MPDLTDLVSPPGTLSTVPTLLLGAGRLLLAVYATVATVLTTACLVLQLLTRFDRWRAARQPLAPAVGPKRERRLFVPLDAE